MHRNIEIKAVIQDVERTVSRAIELSDTAQIKIEQHDIFFKAKDGRLKLRKFKVGMIINFSVNTSIFSGLKYIFQSLELFLNEIIDDLCTSKD